ncbi:MAG: hypothetical protein ACLRYY_12590 [Anaerobutyricum soehngenii]
MTKLKHFAFSFALAGALHLAWHCNKHKELQLPNYYNGTCSQNRYFSKQRSFY